MRTLALIVAGLVLAGCAGMPASGGPTEYERLADDCRERGGILVNSGRPPTGRVQVDNVCEIRGGGSTARR